MKTRHATILLLVLAALGVACLVLSPPTGPAAISTILLPAKFVVRGDTMRDSAGAPAPPVIDQFNSKGQLIGGEAPQFFILYSAPAAHFTPGTGILVGDHLGLVNFIGQIRGLQTPTVQVAVTVKPTVIDQGSGALDTIKAPLTLLPETSLLESFCDNHNSTMEHRRIGGVPVEPPSPRVP